MFIKWSEFIDQSAFWHKAKFNCDYNWQEYEDANMSNLILFSHFLKSEKNDKNKEKAGS